MRKKLLSLMLAAAGLFSPAASNMLAQGTIVTPLPQPLDIFSSFLTVFYPIDLNGDGLADFTFAAEAGFVGLRTERSNRVIVRLSPPPNIGGPVARIEDGFIVGGSLDPQLAWISSDPTGGYVSPGEIAFALLVMVYDTGSLSDWPGGPFTRAFIGFEFELGDGLHYGYFAIDLRGDIPGAVLHGWAYNSTPNAPIFAGSGIDSDNDGVWDLSDECSDTPAGEAVDANGCSISQLVPCAGPWKNHGEYVARLIATVAQFQMERLVTPAEARKMVAEAARSDCGKPRAPRAHQGRIDWER